MDETPLGRKKKQTIVLGWATVFLLVAIVLIGLGALLLNAYNGAQTRNLIIDCVEPTGQCAERATDRTAQVVDDLIKANQLDEVATRRIVVISVTCQQLPGIDTLDEVQACVDGQLALDKEEAGGK